MNRLAVVTVVLALALPPAAAEPQATRRPCKEHPAVKRPCFTVRGRLSYWSGSPSARIWIVGTKRMLGISDGHALPGFEQMPDDLRSRLSWDVNLLGDFEFCPFAPDRPGVMRVGCIQSARNVRAVKAR